MCDSAGQVNHSMLDIKDILRNLVETLNAMSETTTAVHNSITEARGNAITTVCDAMLSVFNYWPKSSNGVGSPEDVAQLTDAMQSLEQTLQTANGNSQVTLAEVQC